MAKMTVVDKKDVQITLGEYVKRLRRDRRWPLHQLAQTSGLSYTHLSRIENDFTIPRPDTVARIATALDGDIKLMLELSGSLPRVVMDRIEPRSSRPISVTPQFALKCAFGYMGDGGDPRPCGNEAPYIWGGQNNIWVSSLCEQHLVEQYGNRRSL